MRALCVDDERLLLDALRRAVERSPDIEEAFGFTDELAALEWAAANPVDIAFLDVRMHELDGLEMAQRLRALYPNLPVVLCTGFAEYALEAFRLHISGYLTKPIRAAEVQREIDHIKSLRGAPQPPPQKKLHVRCFGSFEAYMDGQPLSFRRRKTRELLAYLVDRQGAVISTRELCAALWEDDNENRMDYLHHLLSDLRGALRRAGVEEVLLNTPVGYAVNVPMLDCDYYDYLAGKPDAVRAYVGEYMARYSWAEYTASRLALQIKKKGLPPPANFLKIS